MSTTTATEYLASLPAADLATAGRVLGDIMGDDFTMTALDVLRLIGAEAAARTAVLDAAAKAEQDRLQARFEAERKTGDRDPQGRIPGDILVGRHDAEGIRGGWEYRVLGVVSNGTLSGTTYRVEHYPTGTPVPGYKHAEVFYSA